MRDITDYSLLSNNTFGIDEKCNRFVEVDRVSELRRFLAEMTAKDYPLLVIGGGSNLLLTGTFEGTVIRSNIKGIEELDSTDDGTTLLRCGSGEVWDDVVEYCVCHNLYGAENLSIIPGDVGASAVQNIGAYGCEVKDVIHEIEAIEIATGRECVIPASECQYGYRQSRFKSEWKNKYVIHHVTYKLSKTFTPRLDYGNILKELSNKGITSPTASGIRNVIIAIRNAKLPDPKVEGNAGSFFMNPIVPRQKFEELLALYPTMPHYSVDEATEKIPAGWLIDQCGWKGRTLGKAGVHDKQALVLVNRGGATGKDIVTLCETIRRDVREKFGITINPEVNFV